jgi:hypothetical protein
MNTSIKSGSIDSETLRNAIGALRLIAHEVH